MAKPRLPLIADLIALAKPKIILLLAITCLCGSLVAAKGNGQLLVPQIWWGLVGLIVSAAGANMLNMWWDRDIDPLMKRTKNRPIPTGRIPANVALALGICLMLLGFFVGASANLLTGALALAGGLFYVLIYTMLLKRNTVQNIVIGGAAGAFPPLVGWAAVQGNVHTLLPWLMFAVIFFWTPPHFWALALLTDADYKAAKIPMYPSVYGEMEARVAILRYLLILIPVTLAAALLAPLGWLYLLMATALGGWWLHAAWRLFMAGQPTVKNPAPARQVFKVSLYYLAFLFAAMVLDAWL